MGEPRGQTSYEALYRVAEQQGGYFTAAQAKASGFSHRQLTYYEKANRFQRARIGLYRLTLFPGSSHEDLYAAWLQAGPRSVVSHESALALYELSDTLPAQIHLIIPPTASRRHEGLRLHTNRLCEDEVTTYAGLRVTTVTRTICDVAAAGLSDELVLQAIHEAIERGLTTAEDLRRAGERRGGRARRLIRRAIEEAHHDVQ